MGPQSANWVFIAMSEWKLGRTDAARASRAKFEELLLKDGKTDTPQIADWRAEMEEVFLSK